jgi:curved DNA-binding protein CbpA
MIDYFALLDVPRRPWLEADFLKQKFIALSSEFHPDRTQGDESQKKESQNRYTGINTAYSCLRNPKERLSHLILLERGEHASELQNVPEGLMDIFMKVADACRKTDHFLDEKAAATSPLLKAQLFERGQECSDQMAALQSKLGGSREELVAALKQLDADWERQARTGTGQRQELLAQLEEVRRLFGFVDRWISQVQERFVQLAL